MNLFNFIVLEKIEYLFIIVVGGSIIGFLIYLIISSIKSSNFLKSGIFSKGKGIVLKINIDKDEMVFFRRSEGDSFKCTYKEFIDSLFKEDKKKFSKWINEISDNEESRNIPIIIKMHSIKNENEIHMLKIKFKDMNHDAIFLYSYDVNEKVRRNLESSQKIDLLTSDTLKKKISERVKKRSFKNYTLGIINFDIYDVIEKRYSKEISNQYIRQLYSLLSDLMPLSLKFYHYQKDQFIFYTEKVKTRIEATNLCENILDSIPSYMLVDVFQFELNPRIGVSAYSLFSIDYKSILDQAYQASLSTHSKRYRVFDNRLITKVRDKQELLKEYNSFKSSISDYVCFNPVYSVLNGSKIGSFCHVIPDSRNIKSISKAYEISNDIGDGDSFSKKLVAGILDSFETKSKTKTIFINGTFKILSILLDYLDNHPDINPTINFIFMNYSEFLEYDERNIELLKRGKMYRMNYGVWASELMEISITKLFKYITWLHVPQSISSSISTDNKKKDELERIFYFTKRYNLKVIASNISDLNNAEVLKTMGVYYLEGSLFENHSNYVSTRQIAKLLDIEEDD